MKLESETLERVFETVRQEFLGVRDIRFSVGPDSDGEDALWIHVVLEDPESSKEAWSWENRLGIREAVRERLEQEEIPYWPYVSFRSLSEDAPATHASGG